jgi:hypothetical protein
MLAVRDSHMSSPSRRSLGHRPRSQQPRPQAAGCVLAPTDCIVRSKFIRRPGLKRVEELKGKLDVLQRWNGVSRQYAEVIYDNAAIPRTRYPCYDSIRRTMEVYDSHAMRAYQPEDFYDDSFLKELDASGFIDEVYTAVKARASSR